MEKRLVVLLAFIAFPIGDRSRFPATAPDVWTAASLWVPLLVTLRAYLLWSREDHFRPLH
jgi:hypothetical protein